jgi:NADH:ubiquinone oxidoreductase subunit D
VGTIDPNIVENWGFSGVLLRSAGISYDLRKTSPYEVYDTVNFLVPVGVYGDSFDRYLIRINEMRQSVYIISQCLNLIPSGLFNTFAQLDKKNLANNSMETLIHHFHFYSEGITTLSNIFSYVSVESPKGEFNVLLVSNDSNNPQRCRIKAPGFLHLQGLDVMVKNHLIADLVTVIGTQDIVFGEIDR